MISEARNMFKALALKLIMHKTKTSGFNPKFFWHAKKSREIFGTPKMLWHFFVQQNHRSCVPLNRSRRLRRIFMIIKIISKEKTSEI
jgi:hypothetical protein